MTHKIYIRSEYSYLAPLRRLALHVEEASSSVLYSWVTRLLSVLPDSSQPPRTPLLLDCRKHAGIISWFWLVGSIRGSSSWGGGMVEESKLQVALFLKCTPGFHPFSTGVQITGTFSHRVHRY